MNDENLIPLNKRPKEEAKKIQIAGGQAWAEICAKRRSMKEKLLLLMSLPSEIREGVDKETSGLLATLERWEKTGDKYAGEFIRDTIGEKPTDKTEFVGDLPPLVLRELKNDKSDGNSNAISTADKSEEEE
jgi:hypothetical protein